MADPDFNRGKPSNVIALALLPIPHYASLCYLNLDESKTAQVIQAA